MLKNLFFVLALCYSTCTLYAQDASSQRIKYITKAPDGTTSIVVYDDSRSNTIELTSKNQFYKLQILDPKTFEPVYSSTSKGMSSSISKQLVSAGEYNIRLYTKHFVITTPITISNSKKISMASEEIVASTD